MKTKQAEGEFFNRNHFYWKEDGLYLKARERNSPMALIITKEDYQTAKEERAKFPTKVKKSK